MIRRDRIVETFCELARIDSPSGEEEEIAQHLVTRLEAMGLDVTRDDYGNVIATDGGDDPLILSAHMDTVEPGRGVKPSVVGERIESDGTTILGGRLQSWSRGDTRSAGVDFRGWHAAPLDRGRIHERGGDRTGRSAEPGLLAHQGQRGGGVRWRGASKPDNVVQP